MEIYRLRIVEQEGKFVVERKIRHEWVTATENNWPCIFSTREEAVQYLEEENRNIKIL